MMLLGIDIDHCLEGKRIVHDKEDAIVEFMKEAKTYREISPSGTGLHLFLKLTAPLKLEAHKKAPFELYTSGRYFTITNTSYGPELPVREVTPEEAVRLLSIIGYPWKTSELAAAADNQAGAPAPLGYHGGYDQGY